jgi:FMN reductase
MRYVGIGGTLSQNSSSEALLRLSLASLQKCGHQVEVFAGTRINLPMYDPKSPDRSPEARALVQAVREADGVILASPGYHGGISGLVKNAIDYIEDTANDQRPYLDGMPVGCITAAFGPQAAVATLTSLRGVVHALRGWPTPYGAAVNTHTLMDPTTGAIAAEVAAQVRRVAAQVVSFGAAIDSGVYENEVCRRAQAPQTV